MTDKEIWGLFLKYQRDNNIKGKCIDNSILWYEIFDRFMNKKYEQIHIEVGTLIVNQGDKALCVVHAWCQYGDGTVVETSTEFRDMEYKKYYTNSITELKSLCTDKTYDYKYHITTLVEFQKNLKRVQSELTYASQYYSDIVTYIEKNISIIPLTVRSAINCHNKSVVVYNKNGNKSVICVQK